MKYNIKEATDDQIYQAYTKAFKEKDKGVEYLFAYAVIKRECDRRKLDYNKVTL